MSETSEFTVQPVSPTPVSTDSKNWALLSHISAFAMFFGIPSMIGPLVVWAIKKQEDPFVDYHGKEAVNFNLSFFIYAIVAGLSILLLVGVVLLPAVFITWFVLVIVATVKAGAGEYYRYPLTIRFIS